MNVNKAAFARSSVASIFVVFYVIVLDIIVSFFSLFFLGRTF